MQELTFSLQPKQRQFLNAVNDYPIVLFGGARGGGKSHALRTILLLRRFEYPGTNGVIFRKTYPELESNHIRPMLKTWPQLKPYWNDTKKLLSLPNGSTLEFAYCANEKDVLNYQGREYQDLAIDEAGQWTETMFRTLHGSNRSADPTIKPRAMLTANPGGVGHGWLKRLFVNKKYKERERSQDYYFIQSLVNDNKALMDNDPDYVHRLNAEPNEALRKAYLYGDWDIAAGQYFSDIRSEIHLVEPFTIPSHWNKFGSYDFGFNHPAAFGYFATDEDGNVYLYREVVQASKRVDEFCSILKQYEDTKSLYPIVAGHDCWVQKGILNNQSPPTIAEEFQKHSIYLKKAVIDRIQGANQVRNYLAWENKPNNRPKFFIFKTCPITYDCLTRMIHDDKNIEDVLKVDSENGDPYTGDDPYDMVRYGLMSRPLLSLAATKNPAWGTKEYGEMQSKLMEEKAMEHFKSLEENLDIATLLR